MSKRRPDVQLTKDNVDDFDHEPEILPQEPSIASEEVLKNRPMIKAKRRLADDAVSVGGSVSNSSGLFSGFQSTFGDKSSIGKFNFGSTSTLTSSVTMNTSKPLFSMSTFVNKSAKLNDTSSVTTTTSTTTTKFGDNNDNKSSTDENNKIQSPTQKYNLKYLNQCFHEHISKYMNSPQVYDFSITCRQYLDYIEKYRQEKRKPSNTDEQQKQQQTQQNPSKEFKFPTIKPTSTSSESTTMFSFGNKQQQPSTTNLDSANSNTFGNKLPNLFTLNSGSVNLTSTPFATFKPPTLPTQTNETDGSTADYAEDQPPKVNTVEHNEKEAVYTIKCKLYYQNAGNYIEKGLGFLYIIVKENAKPQLLIRAGTSTGNILLNIALVSSLPVSKADKNKGVMLTCIPNPEIDPPKDSQANGQPNGDARKTVTFFIRVKPEHCDQLYDAIVKYRS